MGRILSISFFLLFASTQINAGVKGLSSYYYEEPEILRSELKQFKGVHIKWINEWRSMSVIMKREFNQDPDEYDFEWLDKRVDIYMNDCTLKIHSNFTVIQKEKTHLQPYTIYLPYCAGFEYIWEYEQSRQGADTDKIGEHYLYVGTPLVEDEDGLREKAVPWGKIGKWIGATLWPIVVDVIYNETKDLKEERKKEREAREARERRDRRLAKEREAAARRDRERAERERANARRERERRIRERDIRAIERVMPRDPSGPHILPGNGRDSGVGAMC